MVCMQRVYFLIFLAALFLFLGLFAISFHLQQRELRDKKPTFEPSAEKPLSREADGIDAFMLESGTNADPAPLSDRVDPALQAEFKKLEKFLATKPEREAILKFLGELSEKIMAADPGSASATLLAFLRSGQDLPIGLDFVVGESGPEEWPSFRAFLLDLLGKVDPEAAARYSLAVVIPAKASTAEYAVSLRVLWNVGGAEKPSPELRQAWLGLLQKKEWSARPDAAWMESMDFAGRFPGALPVFVPMATEWLAEPEASGGKAEAAQLALERATRNHPVETLAGLLQNPNWLGAGRGPAIRATLFARLDVRDSAQKELLERYFASLDSQGREAQAFFKAFPYRRFHVSPGLSGHPDLQTTEEIRASNIASEEYFRQIEAEQKFPQFRENIEKIRKRLTDLNRVK